MPLKVVDATGADFPEMMRIDQEAYKGSPVSSLFFPHGRTPEVLDLQQKDLLKQAQEDRSVRNIKVIDTDHNDEPIAFARWHLLYGDNAQNARGDSNKKFTIPGGDQANLAMWNDSVRKRRVEYIGRTPHCCRD